MAYARSIALATLDTALSDVDGRLKKYSAGPAPHPDVQEYFFMATILVAFASLESYFDDLFDRIAKGLGAIHGTPQAQLLDAPLKAVLLTCVPQLEDAHRRLLGMNDSADYLKFMERSAASPLLAFIGGGAGPAFSLQGSQLHQNKKYPSPDNVRRIMTRIGASTFFSQLDQRFHFQSENWLQALNDIRTEVAHQGTLPQQVGTVADVHAYLGRVYLFAKRTDRIVYDHVRKSAALGDAWWNAHILV